MSPPFFQRLSELDRIIATGPVGVDFKKTVLPFLLEDASRTYFFSKIADPRWIDVLDRAKQFEHPPGGNRRWPQAQLLARVVAAAPHKVLEICLKTIESENPWIQEAIAEAALRMPPDLASKLVPGAVKWMKASTARLLGERLSSVVVHLAGGGHAEEAFRLAKALLAVEPDPKGTQAFVRGGETRHLPPEPRSRFDVWEYEQVLRRMMPALVPAAGERALDMLCDLLERAIRLSRLRQGRGREDYSYVWRPAIEDHEQNRDYGLKELLVSAVRDGAEALANRSPRAVRRIVSALEKRQWKVLQRIALHVLRKYPDTAKDLVAIRLSDRSRFDDPSLRHEYALLARDHFAKLSPVHRRTIMGWIEAGPHEVPKRLGGEDAHRYAEMWRRDRLAPIAGALPKRWKERYDNLVAQFGPPVHAELVTISTSWIGPTAPTSVKELAGMSLDELLGYLRTWEPPSEPGGASREGLERSLSTLVESDPERFSKDAGRFKGLDPTYLRGLLNGLREAVQHRKRFPWSPVLDVAHWVVEQSREIAGGARLADEDPSWAWARKAVAELLSGGFEKGASEIPIDLRGRAWDGLYPLTDDPEPTPEYEVTYGGANLDPATLSINTVRGEAMNAVVQYALWIWRNGGRDRVVAGDLAGGFGEIPEVRGVLEAHLDPVREPTLTIRSVYGRWFPWLVLLDSAWATRHVARIFPRGANQRSLRDAAWETYVVFCPPYDNVFEILREEYARAIDMLGADSRDRHLVADPEERLAEHLMLLYARGKVELGDSLLVRFYQKSTDKLREHAFRFIGHSLRVRESAPPQVLERLRTLWTDRLEAARTATAPQEFSRELGVFGWWFYSGKFDTSWALAQLGAVISLVGRVDAAPQVVERLATVVSEATREVLESLAGIIESDKQEFLVHGTRDQINGILSTGLGSEDPTIREASIQLVNRLGELGYLEFGVLLSQPAKSS